MFAATFAWTQSISWAQVIPGPTDATGILECDSGRIGCLIQQGNIARVDWNGAMALPMDLHLGDFIEPIAGGSLLVGHFNQWDVLGGFLLSGGNAFSDFFVARLDASGNVLWVRNSVSISTLSPVITKVCSDASGRLGLLVRNGPHFSWNGDTVISTEPNQYHLMVLNSSGDLEWSRPIGTFGAGYALQPSPFSGMTFDLEGHLWISSPFQNDIAISGDTFQVSSAGYDQLIAQFEGNGDIRGSRTIPGDYNNAIGVICHDLAPRTGGGVHWIGQYGPQTMLDNDTLPYSGDGDGLIIALQDSVHPQSFITASSIATDRFLAGSIDPSDGNLLVVGNMGPGALISNVDTLPAGNSTMIMCRINANEELETLMVLGFPTAGGTASAYPVELLSTESPLYVAGGTSSWMTFTNGSVVAPSRFLLRIDRDEAVAIPERLHCDELRLWPSPCEEGLFVRLDGDGSATWSISLNSIDGHLIRPVSVDFRSGTDAQIDVAELHPGVYLLTAINAGKSLHRRFIKQ